MKVFKARPDHPGAAHYAIHAYDDPRHARLALPAARRYAEIAPDAGHALHMPSHIFLQLGMWDQAAASNERSWSASSRWVREHARPVTELDIHSLHWLLYVYLQQGRNQQGEALLRTMRETLAGFPKDDPQMLAFATYTQAMMAATYLIETEQWQRAQEILGPPPPDVATQPFVAIANSPATFARGMAAAVAGSADEARKSAETLRTLRTPPEAAKLPYIAGIVAATRVQAQMIDATAAASRQDFASALDVARQAAAAPARTAPPPGPPPVVKPPHELLGDIALKAGEQKAARESYRIALSRHQGRARSLLGAARAAAAGGNARQSRSFYGTLRKQWRGDATLPALGAAK